MDKTKKRFLVKKYVFAKDAREAMRIEKNTAPEEVVPEPEDEDKKVGY